MKLKSGILIIFTFLISTVCINAQTPVGVWKTVDDNTGEAKSHVEIYEQGGKYFGKIVKLLQRDPDTKCISCTGDKKNKPLIGLVILDNLKPVKEYWGKGTIMDPETGKEYGCSIWFEDGKTNELKVRGKHWTGLYRTQSWFKVN